MLRLLLSGVICGIWLLTALPAWAAPAVSVPRLEHDFGTIFQGEIVRHVFTFSNSGDAPLTVDKVSSSCGCTAALASAKVLEPGMSGEIQASFDSTRFRGAVTKVIYLYTNDPAQPMIQLRIKGTVQEELVMEPQIVNFGAVAPKTQARAAVTLTNRGLRELQLNGLETTTPELAAKFSATAIPAGGQASVELILTPKPGQARFSGYVLFKAAGAIQHDLRIPVYADLGGHAASLQ